MSCLLARLTVMSGVSQASLRGPLCDVVMTLLSVSVGVVSSLFCGSMSPLNELRGGAASSRRLTLILSVIRWPPLLSEDVGTTVTISQTSEIRRLRIQLYKLPYSPLAMCDKSELRLCSDIDSFRFLEVIGSVCKRRREVHVNTQTTCRQTKQPDRRRTNYREPDCRRTNYRQSDCRRTNRRQSDCRRTSCRQSDCRRTKRRQSDCRRTSSRWTSRRRTNCGQTAYTLTTDGGRFCTEIGASNTGSLFTLAETGVGVILLFFGVCIDDIACARISTEPSTLAAYSNKQETVEQEIFVSTIFAF
mgnify:CR=1 FL=1